MSGSRHKAIFVVATLLVAGWGVAGLLQMPRWCDDGYTANLDHTIIRVDSAGPAVAAGLQVGDSIVSIGGVHVDDLSAPPRRALPDAGHPLTIEVQRDGELFAAELVCASYPWPYQRSRINGAVLALFFMATATWVFFKALTPAGLIYALFGLAFGASLFEGPRVGTLEGVAGLIEVAAGVLSIVLLLHLFLVFPRSKEIIRKPLTLWLMYGPIVLFLATGIVELMLDPVIYTEFEIATLVLVLVYLLLAIVAFANSWLKSSRLERKHSGLNLILLGLAVAVVPLLVRGVASLAGVLDLPGHGYYSLSAVAIPLTMAVTVVRSAVFAQPSHSSPK